MRFSIWSIGSPSFPRSVMRSESRGCSPWPTGHHGRGGSCRTAPRAVSPRGPGAGVVVLGVVLGLTGFVDLIVAVSVGIVAASLLFVKRMSDLQLENVRTGADGLPYTRKEQEILDRHADEIMIYHISGPMNFGAAKGLTRQIAVNTDFKVLVLDLSDVTFIDTSASMAIEDVMVTATGLGLEVILIGIKGQVKTTLERLGITRVIPAGHAIDTRLDALRLTAKLPEARKTPPA